MVQMASELQNVFECKTPPTTGKNRVPNKKTASAQVTKCFLHNVRKSSRVIVHSMSFVGIFKLFTVLSAVVHFNVACKWNDKKDSYKS